MTRNQPFRSRFLRNREHDISDTEVASASDHKKEDNGTDKSTTAQADDIEQNDSNNMKKTRLCAYMCSLFYATLIE